jgi:hypothetical protein
MTDNLVDPEVVGAFREVTQSVSVRGLPMSHLSIEVGHFYMDDLKAGIARIEEQFRRVEPLVRAIEARADNGNNPRRVSTCFLVDDYFPSDTHPAPIMEMLLRAAKNVGLRLDYVAREAACAVADEVRVAELVAARVHSEPAPGTNGSRPPVAESGWLANGKRSPGFDSAEAMQARAWAPPQEFAPRNHSIFLDVELWKEKEELVDGVPITERTWSCPLLASVWQLLRLGLIRNFGEPVAVPQLWPSSRSWPERWDELPPVMQLEPDAHPFSAYRAASVMPQSYLPIEHAVRTIMDHVTVEPEVLAQIKLRARNEGVRLPSSPSDRVTHLFVEGHTDDD